MGAKRPHHLGVFFLCRESTTRAICTLSLHDALPIFAKVFEVDPLRCVCGSTMRVVAFILDPAVIRKILQHRRVQEDRKSTRLNSSHTVISYAVFCLKKKTGTGLPSVWPSPMSGRSRW